MMAPGSQLPRTIRGNRLRATYAGTVMVGLAVSTATPVDAQSWRSMTSTRTNQGEERLDVRIDYGAGTIELGRAERGVLYGFELRYDEELVRPVVEFGRDPMRLRLGTKSMEGRTQTLSRSSSRAGHASIRLSPDVPMDLEIRFGAGDARLELGGLAIRSADVSTGASETTIGFGSPNPIAANHVRIRSGASALRAESLGNSGAAVFELEGGFGESVLDFGGHWRRDANATVKLGMGSVRLRFPRDIGVRLTRSTFLTRFDGGGLQRRGDGYYSENWDRSTHRLTVHVVTAVGAIDIEWID